MEPSESMMRKATCPSAHARRRLRLAPALVAAVVMGGAVGVRAQKPPQAQSVDKTPVQTVWPLPPDEPRVRYVSVYESKQDVADAKSAKASSLRDMLLGKDASSSTRKKKRTLEKPFG